MKRKDMAFILSDKLIDTTAQKQTRAGRGKRSSPPAVHFGGVLGGKTIYASFGNCVPGILNGSERVRVRFNKDSIVFSPSVSPADNKISLFRGNYSVSCGKLRRLGVDGKSYALQPCNLGYVIDLNKPLS